MRHRASAVCRRSQRTGLNSVGGRANHRRMRTSSLALILAACGGAVPASEPLPAPSPSPFEAPLPPAAAARVHRFVGPATIDGGDSRAAKVPAGALAVLAPARSGECHVSPKGDLMLEEREGALQVRELPSMKLRGTIAGDGYLRDLAFSPRGDRVAVAGEHAVRVVDLASLAIAWEIPQRDVERIVFDAEGRQLLYRSYGAGWSIASSGTDPPKRLPFAEDADHVALAGSTLVLSRSGVTDNVEASIVVCDMKGKALAEWSVPGPSAPAVWISEDGERIAAAARGITIWDRAGELRLARGAGTPFAWTPDGGFVASSGPDMVRFDASGARVGLFHGAGFFPKSLGVSDTGRLWVGGYEGVWSWDGAGRPHFGAFSTLPAPWVLGLGDEIRWAQGARLFVLNHRGAIIAVEELADHVVASALASAPASADLPDRLARGLKAAAAVVGPVQDARITSRGDIVAMGSEALFIVPRQGAARTLTFESSDRAGQLALLGISGDGRLLAVGGYDVDLRVIALETATIAHTLAVKRYERVAFDHGGTRLAVTHEDSLTVDLYELERGKHLGAVETPREAYVFDAALLSDGRLVVASTDALRTYGADRELIRTLPVGRQERLAMSADEKRLASAGEGAYLWDVAKLFLP
jgi:hypothetical protein